MNLKGVKQVRVAGDFPHEPIDLPDLAHLIVIAVNSFQSKTSLGNISYPFIAQTQSPQPQ